MKIILAASLILSFSARAETARIIINKDAAESQTVTDEGYKITHLRQGSNAYEAGVRDGDFLVRIGNERINSVASFAEGLNILTSSNEILEVEVIRNGEHRTMQVKGRGLNAGAGK